MAEHGYRLLHIGQETLNDEWHATVIVLGTTDRTNRDRLAAKREAEFAAFRQKYPASLGG
jgi:hypothetical protein